MNVNSNIRKRNKQVISDRYKKVDTTVNADAERLVEEHREIEKRLYPLRIDQRTVIYVTKDKCTKEYAQKRRRQFGIEPSPERKGGNPRVHIEVEEVNKLVQEGMHLKDIARTLGVSRTTVSKYIQKYDLRRNGNK
ncbi:MULTISPECIES: helix-turn-helix domain-containing protein [Bacteroides]|uniref:helix-turn-helix domain-containing protein n=1 Tax=Bacteroides TaxID=816 RepID=UPI000E53FA7A|nr:MULTISPECIES: helix-turn-helix domain-containing protein [Bacteroides]RHL10409.1 LacI family DNA-binding transcriptional regulator [Bacteroides sp. AF39-11AC]DAZ53207.1 MAG TPA: TRANSCRIPTIONAL REGULATOR MODE REGULATION, DNA BINDING, MOLYBDATE [Caudoviricetes sp.]